MIIGNLMTYGLRMRVNRAVLQSVLPLPLSRDDVITLVAIPGSCVLFALGALLVEWLGLRMLLAQEKVGWRLDPACTKDCLCHNHSHLSIQLSHAACCQVVNITCPPAASLPVALAT